MFFFYLHTETNMQNPHLETQENIKITTSIAFVIIFSSTRVQRTFIWVLNKYCRDTVQNSYQEMQENIKITTSIAFELDSQVLESDEHSSGC